MTGIRQQMAHVCRWRRRAVSIERAGDGRVTVTLKTKTSEVVQYALTSVMLVQLVNQAVGTMNANLGGFLGDVGMI
jgi:hypothetical protein